MNFKKSLLAIQDKNSGSLDDEEYYPTIEDLMKEQAVSHDDVNMVHRRRDLDSLG